MTEKPPWSYVAPADGRAGPDDFARLIWSYSEEAGFLPNPFRSQTEVATLVYAAYEASLQSEEGRQLRFRMVFGKEPILPSVGFTAPIPCTAKQLVKLAPTIGLSSRWLTIDRQVEGTGLVVKGILDPEILPVSRRQQRLSSGTLPETPAGARFSVFGPACIRFLQAGVQFDLARSNIRQPTQLGSIRWVSDWVTETRDRLKLGRDGGIFLRRFLLSVLTQMSEQRHGGCLVVPPFGAYLEARP
jgi:hypothetical protein